MAINGFPNIISIGSPGKATNKKGPPTTTKGKVVSKSTKTTKRTGTGRGIFSF